MQGHTTKTTLCQTVDIASRNQDRLIGPAADPRMHHVTDGLWFECPRCGCVLECCLVQMCCTHLPRSVEGKMRQLVAAIAADHLVSSVQHPEISRQRNLTLNGVCFRMHRIAMGVGLDRYIVLLVVVAAVAILQHQRGNYGHALTLYNKGAIRNHHGTVA